MPQLDFHLNCTKFIMVEAHQGAHEWEACIVHAGRVAPAYFDWILHWYWPQDSLIAETWSGVQRAWGKISLAIRQSEICWRHKLVEGAFLGQEVGHSAVPWVTACLAYVNNGSSTHLLICLSALQSCHTVLTPSVSVASVVSIVIACEATTTQLCDTWWVVDIPARLIDDLQV
jgi:hypothetical protein